MREAIPLMGDFRVDQANGLVYCSNAQLFQE